MFRSIALALSILVCASPALADSWDSDKNIERAMDEAVKTYKTAGVAGLVRKSRNCYSGLDTGRDNRNAGRDVEYCIAYELSSVVIDNSVSKAMNFPRNDDLQLKDAAARAMYNLERAKLVTLPEELDRYLAQRLEKIAAELPARM